jgi:hypothetical protein
MFGHIQQSIASFEDTPLCGEVFQQLIVYFRFIFFGLILFCYVLRG